jgi:hypothetical protein
MISFWLPAGNPAMRIYRSNRGQPIAGAFEPRVYDEIADGTEISTGPQVFAGLDQLSPVERRAVAALWDEHARLAPHARRLNDPRRVLLRFELLDTLARRGLNSFGVHHAADLERVNRFPVFVRRISMHGGTKTPLLTSRAEVRDAVRALRLRGHPRHDLMVVEFADVSDASGQYAKYAAFRVGDQVLAAHAFMGRYWEVKSEQNEITEQSARWEREFVEANPHEAWLRHVFELADIEYGRIDYGVDRHGRPQAWEINLNPTLGREPGQSRHNNLPATVMSIRTGTRELVHERLRAAFLTLGSHDGDRVLVRLAPDLLRLLQADRRARRRSAELRAWADGIYGHKILGLPLRTVYAFFPRRVHARMGR